MAMLGTGRIWICIGVALLLLVPAVVVIFAALPGDDPAPEDGVPAALPPPGSAATPQASKPSPGPAAPPTNDAPTGDFVTFPSFRAAFPRPTPLLAPLSRFAIGLVKTTDSRPIAGAHVAVATPRSSLALVLSPRPIQGRTTTDARGAFALEVNPADAGDARPLRSVILTVEADGYLPYRGTFRVGHERVVRLRRPGSLDGRVQTDDQPPVPCAGATVTLGTGQNTGGGDTPTRRTDAIGRYRFDRLTPGDYRVQVRFEGRPPLNDQTVQIHAGEHTRANFTIESGITVTGRVVEGPTGRPVAGVKVYTVVTPGRPTVTDADGRFRVTGLPRSVSLMLVKPDWVPRTVPLEIDKADKHVDRNVEMVRWASVRGQVFGPDGKPYPLARVWIVSPRECVWSDEDGRFELPNVHPGEGIRVQARSHRRFLGRSDPIALGSGETSNAVAIRLTPVPPSPRDAARPSSPLEFRKGVGVVVKRGSAIVKGVLVDEHGTPLPAVRVTLYSPAPVHSAGGAPDELSLQLATRVKSATSAAEGAFEFTRLPAGRYLVEARQTGYLPERSAPFDLPEDGVVSDRRLVLPRGFSVEILVQDTDGNALRGASIMVRRPGYRQSDWVRGKTDLEGRVSLGPVAAATYRVSAFATGGRYQPVEVTFAPGVEASLVFKRRIIHTSTGRFEGRVTLAETGEPAPSFWVRVYRGNGSGERNFANAAGRFTWKTGRPGTFEVEAGTRDGRISEQRATVTITRGAPPPTAHFRLQAGTKVSGVVLDPAGRPVANAPVNFHRGSRDGPVARSVRTESDGAFVASGLRAGVYVLAASVEAWVEGTARVTAGPGEAPPVTVRLLRDGGVIAARIQDHLGRPAAGAEITVKRMNGEVVLPGLPQVKRLYKAAARRQPGLRWSDFFVAHFASDRDGRVTQSFVPPGRYRVHARHRTANAPRVEVVVQGGRTTPVTLVLGPPTADR